LISPALNRDGLLPPSVKLRRAAQQVHPKSTQPQSSSRVPEARSGSPTVPDRPSTVRPGRGGRKARRAFHRGCTSRRWANRTGGDGTPYRGGVPRAPRSAVSRVAARVPLRWPVLLTLLVALLVPAGPVSARAHQVADGATRAVGTATPVRTDPGTRRSAASDAAVLQASALVAGSSVSAVAAPAVRTPRPVGSWTCAPEDATAGPAATWSPRCGRGPPGPAA
jgi:hypothetical protein